DPQAGPSGAVGDRDGVVAGPVAEAAQLRQAVALQWFRIGHLPAVERGLARDAPRVLRPRREGERQHVVRPDRVAVDEQEVVAVVVRGDRPGAGVGQCPPDREPGLVRRQLDALDVAVAEAGRGPQLLPELHPGRAGRDLPGPRLGDAVTVVEAVAGLAPPL